MRPFFSVLLVLAATIPFSKSTVVLAIQTSYTQLQSSSESELGIAEYPGVKFLPEATRRLLQDKASTWLLVRVYHSDDSIKRVTKHFKEYAQKAAKDGFAGDAVTGPLEKSLLRDNWRLKQSLIRYAATIFGVGTELMASAPAEKVETSFGIILLSDSFVRVHLISPHPSPSDNNKLSSGTMIVLIRERREGVGNADNENHADEEKVYTGREVTRRARVKSKPEPEYPTSGVGGVVVLRAVFSASGKVMHIRVVSGLPGGFTEAAVKAAQKISFEPAIKDGRYVSQWIQLEYHFHP